MSKFYQVILIHRRNEFRGAKHSSELVKKLENMLNEQNQVLDKINEGKMDFKDISSDERKFETKITLKVFLPM